MALECHWWGSPCAPVTLEGSPGWGSGRKRRRGGPRGGQPHRRGKAAAWSRAWGRRTVMVKEWPSQGPACSPWEHSPAAWEAGGAPRQPGDPGRPSIPALPPALLSPTHPPRSAGITVCGPRWAASQWVLLLSLFCLTGCYSLSDSVGRCRHGRGWKTVTSAKAGLQGGPGWVGSPPGPTRAQVGLTSLSQAWPQDCKTKTSPLISLFPLLPGPLGSPHFIHSFTHSSMKSPAGASRHRNEWVPSHP